MKTALYFEIASLITSAGILALSCTKTEVKSSSESARSPIAGHLLTEIAVTSDKTVASQVRTKTLRSVEASECKPVYSRENPSEIIEWRKMETCSERVYSETIGSDDICPASVGGMPEYTWLNIEAWGNVVYANLNDCQNAPRETVGIYCNRRFGFDELSGPFVHLPPAIGSDSTFEGQLTVDTEILPPLPNQSSYPVFCVFQAGTEDEASRFLYTAKSLLDCQRKQGTEPCLVERVNPEVANPYTVDDVYGSTFCTSSSANSTTPTPTAPQSLFPSPQKIAFPTPNPASLGKSNTFESGAP